MNSACPSARLGGEVEQRVADEDLILTAWQYRMMQRDIAASKGKYLPAKRDVRNSFRTAAVESIRPAHGRHVVPRRRRRRDRARRRR